MKNGTQTAPAFYKNGSDVEIHKNPSASELQKMVHKSEAKSARGIMHGDDVYMFDAMHAIHSDVSDHLKLNSKSHDHFSVGRDHYSSEYIRNDEQLDRIKNHPWIKKTIPNHRFFHS
jgi:hypothetical protein